MVVHLGCERYVPPIQPRMHHQQGLTMALNDAKVRKAKPESKQYKLGDAGGLFILIHPNGSKYWRWRYRFAGKQKTLALGVYPVVTLAAAREARTAAAAQLADGLDPSAMRKIEKVQTAERAENTFEVVSREWHVKHEPTWAESHSKRIIARLEQHVFPWLGTRPIADIKAPELLTVLRRIESKGALESAHRMRTISGQVFRYAVATGRAERDISQDLRGALPPVQKKHFSAITDPSKIGELLRAIDGYSGTFPVVCALKLAPMLFQRPGELRQMQWTDVNLEVGEWNFTASKQRTGVEPVVHTVPLSKQAVEILRELHPLTGHGRYVFPSPRTRDGSRPMSDNAVLSALRRMGIEKDEMTGHGFRALARTVLDEVLAFRVELIEHQLSHSVRDPLGRAYNRTKHLPERRKMMQSWADYLEGLKLGADVVKLGERRA